MRVLLWILDRVEGKVEAKETAIGYVPYVDDINIEDLSVSRETLADLLAVDIASWKLDIENIKEFYTLVGDRVPSELYSELEALEKRLG